MIQRRSNLRLLAASASAAFLLPISAKAESSDPAKSDWRETSARVGVQTYDVLLLRPLQVAATVVGFGAFVPASLITSPGGMESIKEAWSIFVVAPGQSAFKRPLGDF